MRMNCPTYHYDNARTGLLVRSNPLQRRRLGGRAWGKYQELDLGAPVRGAVLFLPDWQIKKGSHSGETHTMLYVATSANLVLSYSEEQLRAGSTNPIWRRTLTIPNTRHGSNIPPPVGVCGTMVLEPDKRRLFVAAMTESGEYRIYSLDLDTGDVLAQAPILDSGANGPVFVGKDHDQRGALLIAGGQVFVTFADFLADDNGPYRGWVVSCATDDLTKQQFLPMGSQRTFGGGIWGPGGATADASNNIFVVTGNSTSSDNDDYWNHLGPGKHPGDVGDFFEAVVRVESTPAAKTGDWTDIHDPALQIPGWFGNENQGGGIALADVNGNGRPDLVVFHIDHPSNGNHGYYRIGWDLNAVGHAASWSNPVQIPGWFGNENQGGGIALADVNGNGRPDLVVFHIDHPSNGNHGYYRIGWNLDAAGNVTGGWTSPIQVPGWFGNENQGGGVAIADLNGNGRPDLIVFHIDHPANGNAGYYRIGWNLDVAGNVTGGWSNPIPIPGWFGNENQGGGIAIGDLNGDGRPDLVVFHLDHPSNGNHGYYRVGWSLDAAGHATGGWSNPVQIPDWFGNENQGGGIAIGNINGNAQPDLVAFHIDHPSGGNHGYYRVGFDLQISRSLVAADWYAPGDTRQLNADDHDLGGASALLVPPQSDEIARLLVTGDKAGNVYLLSSASLGHWAGEVQRIHPFNGEVRCAPAFYRAANGDRIVYLSGAGRPGLCAFKIGTQDGRFGLHEFWQAKDIFGSTVGFANAAGSPIVITTPATDRLGELPLVWVTDGGDDHNPSALWAFNGLDGTELFNSLRDPNDRSAVLPHYPPMSCTENSVFVGTNRGLACYRLPALSAAAQLNLVAFNLDHPSGGNHGYCRMTREGLDSSGGAVWGTAAQIPGWFGNENQGGGIATADINGNGRPDLVVFHIDHPSNGNHGYYRIGWDLTPAGRAASWGSPVQIPGWFGNENQGGGIAVGDLDGNGRPDLVVFHIDHPSNGNHGYYRVGKNLDTAGNVTGGWSNPIQIPGWFGNENQGGGIALADVNGNGRPDLIVFHIDHPSNGNHGYYRIGWNLDAAGNVTGGWSSPVQIPGWFGNENQGGSIAVADVNGDGRPDLIVFHLDHPSNGNHGYYRIGWKLDITGNVTGGWSSPVQIPGWFGNEDQAGAVAAANLPFSWSWPDLATM